MRVGKAGSSCLASLARRNDKNSFTYRGASYREMPRLRDCRGFCLRVEFIDLLSVAFFDHAAAEFECRRENTVLDCEFVRDQHDSFQLFKARQILVDAFDDGFVERLHFRICNEFAFATKS